MGIGLAVEGGIKTGPPGKEDIVKQHCQLEVLSSGIHGSSKSDLASHAATIGTGPEMLLAAGLFSIAMMSLSLVAVLHAAWI